MRRDPAPRYRQQEGGASCPKSSMLAALSAPPVHWLAAIPSLANVTCVMLLPFWGVEVMAQATVFVDDAVLGRLPPVCVKDGVLTDDSLTLHTQVGGSNGLGIAWLLLLAGPLGWLGLLIVAVSRRPADTLTVRLPFSQAAYERLRRAKRDIWLFGLVAIVLLILALFAVGHDQALLAGALGVACCVALVQWVRSLVRVRADSVVVNLDASRRWVTLFRVHPTFVQSLYPNSQTSTFV